MSAPRPTQGFDAVFVIVCSDGLVRAPVDVELSEPNAQARIRLSDMRCGCFAGGHTWRRLTLTKGGDT